MGHTVTLAQLRSRARLYADQRPGGADVFVEDDDVNTLINLACQEFYDLLVVLQGHEYFEEEDTSITTEDGLPVYDLPSDLYRLLSVHLAWSESCFEQVRGLNNIADRPGGTSATWTEGSPKAYRLRAQLLEFFPTPTAETNVVLRYVPTFQELVGDAAELDDVNGWSNLVTLKVAMKLKAIANESMGQLNQLYQTERDRILELAADRAATEPAQIRDVNSDGAYGISPIVIGGGGGGITRVDAGNPALFYNMPYIDLRHYTVGDGDGEGGGTDDSVGIQEAWTLANSTGRTLWIPGGYIFRCDTQIALGEGCNFRCIWDGTIDATNMSFPGREACITFGTHNTTDQGADGLTALPDLAAHANAGGLTITLASAPTLTEGDLFIICNADDYSWNDNLIDNRPYYHAGDFCRVHRVSGSVVTVDKPLFGTYLTSENIELHKLTSPNYVRIEGTGKLLCPGLAAFDNGIHITNGYRCRVGGITIEGARYAAVELWRCFDCDVEGLNSATWNPLTNEGAGVFMISCFNTWVKGSGTLKNGKHGCSLTGGDVFNAVPNRLCGAKGAELHADNGAADMHGHCEHCGWFDCTIYGQATLGGNHASLVGGKVITCSDLNNLGAQGLGIRFRELQGASHTIDTELFVQQVADSGLFPIELDCFENTLAGNVTATIKSHAGANNETLAYISTETAGLVRAYISLNYKGPPGFNRPTLEVHSGATGYFITARVEGKGFSPQCNDVAGDLIHFDNIECVSGETVGLLLGCKAHPAGRRQILKATNCYTDFCDTVGIRVSGPGVGEDVWAIVENCTSTNNGQDAAGSEAVQLKVSGIKHFTHKNNTYDDIQAVPTQSGLVVFDGVTTVDGHGNGNLGATNYGTSEDHRSQAGVTNDLEKIELTGSASPEGVVYSPPGAIYSQRTSSTEVLWRKAYGAWNTNTGWEQVNPDWTRWGFPSAAKQRPIVLSEDFTGLTSIGYRGFTELVSGAAAAITAGTTPAAGYVGVHTFSTGTDTTGSAGLITGTGAVRFSGGVMYFRCDAIYTTASDGTDRYYGLIGFVDSAGLSTDGAYFRYRDDENGGEWQAVTVNNTTATTTDTNITLGAGTLRIFEIGVNAAGTEVKFYIDGVLKATHTTNIPTGSGRETGAGAFITKTAGTTARTMSLHKLQFKFEGTNAV